MTVSHTATAIHSAKDRDSEPTEVTRGSTAKTIPAMIAMRRVKSRFPRTTVPAAASPTAMALGRRMDSSDAPNRSIHPRRNR